MHQIERKVEALLRRSDELWEQRQYQEAVRRAQVALALARTKLGVDHPATAAAMNNLGSMAQSLGDLTGALAYFEEALAINLRVLGPEHESIRRGLNTLYTSISDLKNAAQALPHWDEVIEILRSCEELSSTPLLIARLAQNLVERGVTVAAVEPGDEKELPREQGDSPWRTVRAEQAAAAYEEAVEWARRLPEADPRSEVVLTQMGHRFRSVGELDRARTCFGMALDCSRKASGEHTEVVATCLHSLAWVLQNMQRPAEALPLEEQALHIRRRLLGQSHPETRTSLYWLARCHRLVENHIRAEELYREAIETFRQIDTVDAAGDATTVKHLAETTSELAEVYELLGDFGLAAARFEEAVAGLRKAGLERSISFVDGIEGLARVERKRGHYAAAEPLLCQAAAAREQLVDQLLSQFGDTFYLIPGQFSQPKLIPTTIVGAEGLRLNQLYDEMRRCVSCLNELALLYWSMGDPRRAEPPLRRAVGFFRNINEIPPLNPSLAAPELREPRPNLDVNDPAYCDVICTLARLYVALERPDTAHLLLDQALEDFRTAELPPEMLRHVKHGLSRDPDVMERLFDTTLRSGRWKTHYSALQIGLARASQAKGEYADARKLLESARDLRVQAVGEEHPDHVAALVELAQLLLSLGEYGEAEPLLHRALAAYKKALGDKHPDTAACLSHLARVCGASGRVAESFAFSRQVVEIQDHLIGQVFSVSSDSQRATFLETLRDDLDRFLTLLLELSHHQTAKAAGLGMDVSGASPGREESADEHMAPGSNDGMVRIGFDLVLRRKALLAEALATQRDASLAAKYSHLRVPLNELALLRMQIARTTLLGPGNEGFKQHQQMLSQWQARKESMEAELARQIPEMNLEQKLRDADCRAVSLALSAGMALVEFVRFRVFDFHAVPARGERRWKGSRYLAFVLTASEPVHPELIDLGKAEPIDRMIREYRAAITDRVEGRSGRDLGEAPSTRNSRAGSDQGRILRVAVFDKLPRALRGSTRLLLAPDGDLARLPFEVLPTDDGRRLIDSHHISYIATGRDALRLGAKPSGGPAEPLVIADPDFDLETGVTGAQQNSTQEASPSVSPPRKPGFWSRWSGRPSSPTPVPGKSERASPPLTVEPASMARSGRHSRDLDRSHLRFARLPGTRVEGERIATLLGVEAWLQARSLESHVKACRSPRIVHVATHGFFLDDQKRDARSELNDWRVLGPRYGSDPGAFSQAGLENPLLRSGLALAGVNCWLAGGTPPAEAEDGLLTAEDVCGLDLLDTDLVVLSACETGLGEIQVGEGVFGLRRAFVLAGAKTLVMSLWKVPDQQTQELMEDFYRRLLAGQSRADALRAAQLALKARCPEPLYWGAFICQGDPGPLHQSRGQRPDEAG